MITKEGIKEIAQSILNLVDHAEIEIDDTSRQFPLYRTTLSEDTLKVFVMLDDKVKGTVTSANLISKTGVKLIEKSEIIVKDITKGVLIVFSIKVVEVIENDRN